MAYHMSSAAAFCHCGTLECIQSEVCCHDAIILTWSDTDMDATHALLLQVEHPGAAAAVDSSAHTALLSHTLTLRGRRHCCGNWSSPAWLRLQAPWRRCRPWPRKRPRPQRPRAVRAPWRPALTLTPTLIPALRHHLRQAARRRRRSAEDGAVLRQALRRGRCRR